MGSWLLPAPLRPHVAAFYAFVRAADDIADNPDLTAAEKIARLERFEAALTGPPALAASLPKAQALRASLAATGVSPRHAQDLLAAFKRDATQLRYRDWPDLLATLCARRRRSGAICSICTARRARSIASPIPCATRSSCSITSRTAGTTTAGSTGCTCRSTASPPPGSGSRRWTSRRPRPRCVRCSIACSMASTRCSSTAGELPRALRSRRLAAESAVILAIARRLAKELRWRDPLAERVELSRLRFRCAG